MVNVREDNSLEYMLLIVLIKARNCGGARSIVASE